MSDEVIWGPLGHGGDYPSGFLPATLVGLLTSASSGLAHSQCLHGRAAEIGAASAGAQTIRPP